jgi:hypothetical protein
VLKHEPPKTMSVPAAGKKYFNLSRASSYAAAARGQLPTIRIGRRLCVPVIALERMLEQVKPRARQDEAFHAGEAA